MQQRMKLWLFILCVCFLLSGCATDGKEGKPAPEKQQAALAGGKITYGSLYEPPTLNPLISDMASTHEVASLVFSGLVYMNDKGEWQPDLAAEVPTLKNGGVSSDGKVITYRLRHNVEWHDGRSFSAEDVIFTWRTIMNYKNSIISREGYELIGSIEAPDRSTLVIRFKEYYPPFLNLFPRVLPKHILEGADLAKAPFNRAPVGTGPFVFTAWRMAEGIDFKANPRYHLGKPILDELTYKIIPDINILLTQMKAGVVDIVGNLDLSLIDQARAIDALNVVTSPTMVWEHIDLNVDNFLFKDVRVRQAIALSIDRPAIIGEAYRGAAAVAATDQWPLSWANRNDLQPPARNVNAAKELLNQAGWKQGSDGVFAKDGIKLSFSLVTTGANKQRENTARLLAQQLREAGIELIPRFVDVPVLFGDVLPSRRFESALYAWFIGADPDNSSLWHSRSIPGPGNAYKGKNYPGWRNAEADRLFDQASRTVDMDSRREIYYRIQELLQAEYPAIPLHFQSNIGVVKKTVLNYRPNASLSGNLWNAWQWAHSAGK